MEIDDFIPTKGSKGKNSNISYDVTVYNNRKKAINVKNKPEKLSSIKQQQLCDSDKNDNDNKEVDQRRQQELEMKKYRYEIIKFGMSGFQKNEAQQAKVALAIKLGAKAPKNENINYKTLIEIKKKEKAQEIKKIKMKKSASGFNVNQLSKNAKKNKKSNSQHKKSNESNILGIYGKVTKEKKIYKKGKVKQNKKN